MKESYSEVSNHRVDQIANLGYNYKGHLFENSLSKVILSDYTRKGILDQFEKILYKCIESVKLIKTNFNYTLPKNFKKFN